MQFPLLLACILLLLSEGKCKLDFSEFYLPPCCLTPSPDTFSGYASRTGVTSKREVPQGKVDKVISRHSHLQLNASIKVNHENLSSKTRNTKIKFYSVIIPIDDLLNPKSIPLSTKQQPQTFGGISIPENKIDTIANSRDYSAASKILEKVFNTDLGKKNDKIKRIIRRKTSPTAKNLALENRFGGRENHLQSNKLVQQYINWESKRITEPENFTAKDAITTTSQQGLQNSATEPQAQIIKRIPSSWVKYLKRALYQSITDGKGLVIEEGANTGTFYSRNNAHHQVVKSKIRFPDTWKSIKSAKLQYVDRMAQVSTTPYGAIYLPQAEGPIVSGVLINSPDGHLHLRVASELYFPEEQAYEQNCGCYLLRPGEILVAYWSVSRVFKENGQPALQYLVYPLPHSVPTPPELLPFSNSEMFHPSEIDPLNNFYENIQHSPNYIEYPKKEPHFPHPIQNHPLNYASKGHGHTMTRNPKPIQPFPNDELFLEHFNQQLGISPSPQPYPISPTPVIGVLEQGVPQQQLGLNNIFLNRPQQHPQNLVHQYQQFALQNALNVQFANGQNNHLHSIQYNDLLNVQEPIPYEQPTQLPIPPSPQPSLSPVPLGQQPEGISVNFQLPVRVNPTDLPQSDPIPPQQNTRISRPTPFPNSIQDIISPQDLQQQQPIRSEQMIPPSTVQEIQQGLVEQPTPTPTGIPIPPSYPFPLEQLPFLVNYPPYFPPAYMDFNMLQQGLLQQGLQKQQQQDNTKQTEGIGNDNNSNNNNVKKAEDQNVEQQNKKGEHDNHTSTRPPMISNILDNEKKYYPVRIPSRHSAMKQYEKYRYERRRRLHKQKLENDINRKGGYILDF